MRVTLTASARGLGLRCRFVGAAGRECHSVSLGPGQGAHCPLAHCPLAGPLRATTRVPSRLPSLVLCSLQGYATRAGVAAGPVSTEQALEVCGTRSRDPPDGGRFVWGQRAGAGPVRTGDCPPDVRGSRVHWSTWVEICIDSWRLRLTGTARRAFRIRVLALKI